MHKSLFHYNVSWNKRSGLAEKLVLRYCLHFKICSNFQYSKHWVAIRGQHVFLRAPATLHLHVAQTALHKYLPDLRWRHTQSHRVWPPVEKHTGKKTVWRGTSGGENGNLIPRHCYDGKYAVSSEYFLDLFIE